MLRELIINAKVVYWWHWNTGEFLKLTWKKIIVDSNENFEICGGDFSREWCTYVSIEYHQMFLGYVTGKCKMSNKVLALELLDICGIPSSLVYLQFRSFCLCSFCFYSRKKDQHSWTSKQSIVNFAAQREFRKYWWPTLISFREWSKTTTQRLTKKK